MDQNNSDIKTIRIISADDVEINQRLLQKYLENENIELTKVYNGEDLVEELEKNNYDLILADIQMPIMTGIEATIIIRENPKHFTIPIIALSAHSSQEDIDEILNAGANDYLVKPVKKDEIIEKINKWYSGNH
jgi:two-component system sensor histidine kinase/response regulator